MRQNNQCPPLLGQMSVNIRLQFSSCCIVEQRRNGNGIESQRIWFSQFWVVSSKLIPLSINFLICEVRLEIKILVKLSSQGCVEPQGRMPEKLFFIKYKVYHVKVQKKALFFSLWETNLILWKMNQQLQTHQHQSNQSKLSGGGHPHFKIEFQAHETE